MRAPRWSAAAPLALLALALASPSLAAAARGVPTVDQAFPPALVRPAASPGAAPGVPNPTLNSYVSDNTLWSSRAVYYRITEWAARTNNCMDNATSVACMACSMERPPFAVGKGVAPIAVANKLWFAPEKGSVCGMCLKVYMPNGTAAPGPGCPDPADPASGPACAGAGSEPLARVAEAGNYGAAVQWDAARQLPFFTAIVIEWFDRNQSDEYALAYPTMKTEGVDRFGSWPVLYEGTPCPVGGDKLQYSLLDTATPIPIINETNQTAWLASGSSPGLPRGHGGSLCNNLVNKPCGELKQVSEAQLSYLSLQITAQRIPLSAVSVRLPDAQWYDMERIDNNWQLSSSPAFPLDPAQPLDLRIRCADGSPALLERGLVPAQALCAYQDPQCRPFTGTVQC